jgi:DNA sulfur modification protein DndE
VSIKQFRLSNQGKDQLIRLKTKTGLTQWNILCRWAFCLSLAEPTSPTPIEIPSDSNLEMTWLTFGGEHHEIYLALLKHRCLQEGHALTAEVLLRVFRLHLHRGIAYLAAPNAVRSLTDLVELAVTERKAK